MMQHLPYGGLQWVDNINRPDFYVVPDDNDIGYIIECDIEIPLHLHEEHKDLPFCPEQMTPPNSKVKKLLTTLYNKKNYVCHYRTLIQARKNGLIVKKIHRALQFKQSPWLKSYIELNTEKRTAAQNEFEKNFFKLLNNSVYGKVRKKLLH